LEEEESVVGNDNPDQQEDYFQTPIQQHKNSVCENNETPSTIIPKSCRGNNSPIVALSNTTIPENQECGKQKKKKIDNDDMSVEDNLDEDGTPTTNDNTKVGVSDANDARDHDGEEDNEDCKNVPKELDSDLGPYWTLAQSSQASVLSTITSYSNIEASKSTPQYGFKRGLKEFGSLGYEATVKELDNNLLGMGAVKMLMPSELNKSIRFEGLNYCLSRIRE
jgi:hypothetical protein